MINITIGTNTTSKKVVVSEDEVLRTVLTENDVNLSVGVIHIDGIPISHSDLDKTLKELNVSDGAFIIIVAKAQNA